MRGQVLSLVYVFYGYEGAGLITCLCCRANGYEGAGLIPCLCCRADGYVLLIVCVALYHADGCCQTNIVPWGH